MPSDDSITGMMGQVPGLPSYGAPAPRRCATLPVIEDSEPPYVPEGVSPPKPPGTLNKMISKMLPKKLGKIAKTSRLKAKLPKGKPGKKRHKVTFK